MKNCPHCHGTYPTHFAVCPQDGTELVETGAWTDGTVVRGKYRIVNKIGQGGMGTVYKAVHVAFDEVRALKVINPSLMSDELFVKRFEHEAVITRRLQHPNAVRVEDIDQAEDGRPFIVMEYIEGRSLKKLIQEEGAMPAARVCGIVKQAAAALDAAHSLGMIHRDIKPENIVLIATPQGERVKVLDFGIAKIKEGRASATSGMTLTGTGVVVGTPSYMSPEQAMGKRGDQLDGRSDLYSLGVVMYQMLSAELPFKAETTMQVLLAHMQEAPKPIRAQHPELNIPVPLADLVMRLLEKDPARRPGSARALIEELEKAEHAPAEVEATRVATRVTPPPAPAATPPGAAYSPEASARALREALAGNLGEQPRPRDSRPGTRDSGFPRAPEPASQSYSQSPPAPKPAPAPAPKPAPVARAAPPPAYVPPHPPRQWGMWAGVGILVLVLGGGAAWFATHQQRSAAPTTQEPAPSPAAGTPPARQESTSPAASSPGSANTSSETEPAAQTPSQETPLPDSNVVPPGETSGSAAAKIVQKTPEPKQQSAKKVTAERKSPPKVSKPVEKPAAPPVDMRAVKAALAMGDLYYQRGDYDNAIREYQRGLTAAPGNSTLTNKIAAARKAKAAEERLLQ